MELGLSSTLLAGDPRLVDHIVGEVKSQGIFDQFRKECIADVDTKPAYQNLRTRVEGSVNSFLDKQLWEPELNKNQLRETLRKHIHEAPYLDAGVERIVDQVVNPKIYSVFMPQIEDVVYKFLGIERPKIKEKVSGCGLKDLLPKDLDPVSPESDKNSLKDVSLESIDAIDDLDVKQDEKCEQQFNEHKSEDTEKYPERNKDVVSENGHVSFEEKASDETCIGFNKAINNTSLNTSGKSDDKADEEEEDSPTFEPIDIMNLNESNISNDSHLSGISELTSHRSRSPDFSNELSQDNFDCSNQDSQLSKVSSDSRLSIVTDFGFSNHAPTPIHDGIKEDIAKDKCENKNTKDNFRALREFESYKNKNNKNIFESKKCKDGVYDSKDAKSIKLNLPSKENSSDATDSSTKDKYDSKNYKDKHKDSENSKSKSTKEKVYSKDSKYKEKDSDKKKQSSHSSSKYEKHTKGKIKEKVNQTKEVIEKNKDNTESIKDNTSKLKEEKIKEIDKKESSTNKEAKDLKDLYKEKIRELREKKELTEKEKLNKDNVKSNKESKDKKDSTKDKKSYKKEHKSSTSKNHDEKSRNENKVNKASDKTLDTKDRKSESKEKTKRDERSSKDVKDKSNVVKTESSSGKSEKSDAKKVSKSGKEEKIEFKKDNKITSDKTCKKDLKTQVQSKTSDRTEKSIDIKKDSKSDGQSKDKKRRDDKKSKTKDDHSSLRKNSNDRRSTDRDGSNGSNSKSSQSSTSSSNTTTSKSSSSSLTKDNNHVSNSSSETSDSIGETQINKMKLQLQNENYDEMNKDNIELVNELHCAQNSNNEDIPQTEIQPSENNLPLKKRPLFNEDELSSSNEVKVKKPKFAKNIHEAKKLMKIRKQMEKQKQKEDKKMEKKVEQKPEVVTRPKPASNMDDLETVPDEERVQIIEIPDEEYEEPYPDRQMSLTLEERSMILLEGELRGTDLLQKQSNLVPKLSDLELCIKQSLDEAICHTRLLQNSNRTQNSNEASQSLIIRETCKDKVASSSSKENLEIKDNIAVLEIVGTTSEKFLDRQSARQVKLIDTNVDNNDKVTSQINVTDTNTSIEDKVICIDKNDNAAEQPKSPARSSTEYNEFDEQSPGQAEAQSSKSEFIPKVNDDHEDCKYFKLDNEESDKFSSFLHSLEMVEGNTLEDMIESLGGQVVSSSTSKPMAPPMPKRKHSGSPLTDILLNNTNNNNDGHKTTTTESNDNSLNNIKKRKIVATKKQRLHANPCVSQSLLNGENFVMPLSPESDVSATSEKIPSSNIMKEEKSRHRSSQRYSSDDLYKPRPLFSSSSRRSRRSNQV
ncbi:hypothetical protein KPH14_007844 [Odynerus spinipes]|uniref:BOD1/SHG1 domain-containing protein n=1 Tax=Odynerus spinipes TaxID=1348599 RepID=A0AAD9VXL1_9HYME|nr:hypothetical protein KPH14_007844 [Odynerus spinipes]